MPREWDDVPTRARASTEPDPIRRSWRRAIRCTPALVAPSRYVSELMELSLALGGPGLQAGYDRFRSHPDGQALLVDRPDLCSVLSDRDALAAMAPGSFGRAYLEFTAQYRFDAVAFDDAHDIAGMGERLGWDDDVQYVLSRGLQLHDLWHTLTSYGPDWGGEAGVMAFTYGQIPSAGVGLVAGILWAIPGEVPRRRWRAYLAEARSRGRRAGNLLTARYEELLPLPVEDVRARLRILPVAEAHPAGIPYSGFRYGLGRAMDRPYEPLAEVGGA